MLYVLYCLDDPAKNDIRMATRGAHLDHIASSGDLVRVAGPLLADDGVTMVGSLIVLEAPDRATAERWARSDPYAKAGLFKSVDIRPWKWSIGVPAPLAPQD